MSIQNEKKKIQKLLKDMAKATEQAKEANQKLSEIIKKEFELKNQDKKSINRDPEIVDYIEEQKQAKRDKEYKSAYDKMITALINNNVSRTPDSLEKSLKTVAPEIARDFVKDFTEYHFEDFMRYLEDNDPLLITVFFAGARKYYSDRDDKTHLKSWDSKYAQRARDIAQNFIDEYFEEHPNSPSKKKFRSRK